MIGGNKSAEEQAEDLEDQGVTGVNIVLRHKLQEWQGYTKKDYQKHIKLYIGKIVEHLQKTDPDAVAAFKADAQKAVVKILGKFNDIQLFRGESYDPDPDKGECMLAVLEYRGETPYMLFFKHGLLGEKVVCTTKYNTSAFNNTVFFFFFGNCEYLV